MSGKEYIEKLETLKKSLNGLSAFYTDIYEKYDIQKTALARTLSYDATPYGTAYFKGNLSEIDTKVLISSCSVDPYRPIQVSFTREYPINRYEHIKVDNKNIIKFDYSKMTCQMEGGWYQGHGDHIGLGYSFFGNISFSSTRLKINIKEKIHRVDETNYLFPAIEIESINYLDDRKCFHMVRVTDHVKVTYYTDVPHNKLSIYSSTYQSHFKKIKSDFQDIPKKLKIETEIYELTLKNKLYANLEGLKDPFFEGKEIEDSTKKYVLKQKKQVKQFIQKIDVLMNKIKLLEPSKKDKLSSIKLNKNSYIGIKCGLANYLVA